MDSFEKIMGNQMWGRGDLSKILYFLETYVMLPIVLKLFSFQDGITFLSTGTPRKHSVLPPPQNCGWEPKFQKNFLWGGTEIFLSFSYVKGFLWAGKLGWESQNPDFSVEGDPTP